MGKLYVHSSLCLSNCLSVTIHEAFGLVTAQLKRYHEL
jgi:hypothetical protein